MYIFAKNVHAFPQRLSYNYYIYYVANNMTANSFPEKSHPKDVLLGRLKQRLHEAFNPEAKPKPIQTATGAFTLHRRTKGGMKKAPELNLLLIPYPRDPQQGFVMPGGKIEPDDSPEQTLRLETRQEIGSELPEEEKKKLPSNYIRQVQNFYHLLAEQIKEALTTTRVTPACRRFFALTGKETSVKALALLDHLFILPTTPGSLLDSAPFVHNLNDLLLDLPLPSIEIPETEIEIEALRALQKPEILQRAIQQLQETFDKILNIQGQRLEHELKSSPVNKFWTQATKRIKHFLAQKPSEPRIPNRPEAPGPYESLAQIDPTLNLVAETIQLLHLTNFAIILQQLLTTDKYNKSLKYPADYITLALLALTQKAPPEKFPDQYIAYFKDGEVLVATLLPPVSEDSQAIPILVRLKVTDTSKEFDLFKLTQNEWEKITSISSSLDTSID